MSKYPNGLYKNTTKLQDKTSQKMFDRIAESVGVDYMSINFNQLNGNCTYTYKFMDENRFYEMVISRKGNIIISRNYRTG